MKFWLKIKKNKYFLNKELKIINKNLVRRQQREEVVPGDWQVGVRAADTQLTGQHAQPLELGEGEPAAALDGAPRWAVLVGEEDLDPCGHKIYFKNQI